VQDDTGVAGQVDGLGDEGLPCAVERLDARVGDIDLRHPRPAGVDREFVAVLLRRQADGRGLHPHRQVLADQDDVVALCAVVQRHREDA